MEVVQAFQREIAIATAASLTPSVSAEVTVQPTTT